jgi:hypothetical protein
MNPFISLSANTASAQLLAVFIQQWLYIGINDRAKCTPRAALGATFQRRLP